MLFSYSDEIEFKKKFVIDFLATWVANNYNDACQRGDHKRLENPPVEDAKELADSAWKAICRDEYSDQVW